MSYIAPSAGVLLGLALARSNRDITNFLAYCLMNGAALVSVLLEYLNIAVPALGGLRGMNWIRYSGDQTVNLVCGFFRSPDIMGLHAPRS